MLKFICTIILFNFYIKLKKSWEWIIILIIAINIIFIIKHPISHSTYILSKYSMLDSISIIIVSLSMWIIILIIIARYYIKNKKININIFILNLISLLVILFIRFSTNNILLFYIWFESSLIPTLILIIMWGNQPERKKASFYIIIYTTVASLPLLFIILKIINSNFHINLSLIYHYPSTININIICLITLTAFIVKLPLFSLHLWLPKAHVEAPVAGSIILAAILLKLGGYGLIRINKSIYYYNSFIVFIILSIAIIGAIITNILCLRQIDLKALIAYSSIGHIRILIIGTISNSKLGQYGRLIIILTHGLTSSCIFILTNFIYENFNTRNIIIINRLLILIPITSLRWILVISRNISLPPRLNLIGEIIIIISSFSIRKINILFIILINLSTSLYSVLLYSIINHNNQLKLINPVLQITSLNFITTISHLWPLLTLTIIPVKLISWCLHFSWINNIKLQI